MPALATALNSVVFSLIMAIWGFSGPRRNRYPQPLVPSSTTLRAMLGLYPAAPSEEKRTQHPPPHLRQGRGDSLCAGTLRQRADWDFSTASGEASFRWRFRRRFELFVRRPRQVKQSDAAAASPTAQPKCIKAVPTGLP